MSFDNVCILFIFVLLSFPHFTMLLSNFLFPSIYLLFHKLLSRLLTQSIKERRHLLKKTFKHTLLLKVNVCKAEKKTMIMIYS